jgi:hypothetical protein
MTEPWLWPSNPEELREYLGLLPEMVADPEFPFGNADRPPSPESQRGMAGQKARGEAMSTKQELYDSLEKARGKLALLVKSCEAMGEVEDELGGWFDGAGAIVGEVMSPVDEALFLLQDLVDAEKKAGEAETE